MNNREFRVLVCGTDTVNPKGGIGFALAGYLSALESANISYELIPTYSPNSYVGKYLLFLLALPKIFRSIRFSIMEDKACIIYSHAGANISLFREGIVTLLARLAGAKTVMHVHSPETIDYLKSPIKKVLFKLVLIGVQRVFVLTPWWKKTYLNMGIKKLIEVVPNPLPVAWEKKAYESISCSNDSTNMKVLVMTRIVKGKGVDLVVESSPYFDDTVKVDIAGDGSMLETLKARVIHLKQEDKIKFFGWVSGADKQELLEKADVFCHPTQLDAMPMNILEAMANGLPVVALDWGPIPDLVPDNKAGLLVEDTEPKKIANAIKKLKDPETRERMGIEAKRWVLDNYTSRKIGIKLHQIFSEMTDQ